MALGKQQKEQVNSFLERRQQHWCTDGQSFLNCLLNRVWCRHVHQFEQQLAQWLSLGSQHRRTQSTGKGEGQMCAEQLQTLVHKTVMLPKTALISLMKLWNWYVILLDTVEGRWWCGIFKSITVKLQKRSQVFKSFLLQVDTKWSVPRDHLSARGKGRPSHAV